MSCVSHGRDDSRLAGAAESGDLYKGGTPLLKLWLPPIWIEGSITDFGDAKHKNFKHFNDLDRVVVFSNNRVRSALLLLGQKIYFTTVSFPSTLCLFFQLHKIPSYKI